MKKFLKILLIIIGIVFLIFAALICIGLFVDMMTISKMVVILMFRKMTIKTMHMSNSI